MNVLVLGGGKSGEHEVSLVSSAAIARNIDGAKHTVFRFASLYPYSPYTRQVSWQSIYRSYRHCLKLD